MLAPHVSTPICTHLSAGGRASCASSRAYPQAWAGQPRQGGADPLRAWLACSGQRLPLWAARGRESVPSCPGLGSNLSRADSETSEACQSTLHRPLGPPLRALARSTTSPLRPCSCGRLPAVARAWSSGPVVATEEEELLRVVRHEVQRYLSPVHSEERAGEAQPGSDAGEVTTSSSSCTAGAGALKTTYTFEW